MLVALPAFLVDQSEKVGWAMRSAHTPESIQEALSYIPSEDRETWTAIGMAVKSELGDSGFDVWDQWSQSASSYKAKDAKATWRSFKEGGGITVGTLIYEAKQRGYKPNGHGAAISQGEWDRLRRQSEERKRLEDEKRAKEEAAAAVEAERVYRAATQAEAFPYLERKGVKAVSGLRVGSWPQREKENCLLVPMRDQTGKLWGLQAFFREPDAELERDRDYLWNSKKQGCYFPVSGNDEALVLCEGLATALSVREATGLACVVCFDRGNLEPVGKVLREKFPDRRLIFAADNDLEAKANYGLESAIDAARSVGGVVAVPHLDGKPCDMNDLHHAKGAESVAAAIEEALPPAPKEQEDSMEVQEQNPGKVICQRLSEIKAKPITWLWPGRIARGKPTMIAGNPGLGKSQITASLAAIVTTGGRWPVDRSTCELGSVLFLSAEDDPADTIRPRLEAAKADVSKVHILKAVVDSYDSAGEEVHRAFNLKADIRRLEEAISQIGDVRLVVIDPVSAYLGNGDSHNNAEVRALLAPLSDMASRQNVAVVLVSHLNKGGAGGEALMRVTGSLAFVAAARAAFIVAKDPEDENRRLFIPAKNNIAKDVGGLAFHIEGCSIDGGIETSLVMWEPEPVNGITADEILRLPTDPDEKDARDDARNFLIGLLRFGDGTDNPTGAKEVLSNARDAGVSEKTLRRAAQDLGVIKSKTGMDGGWLWSLPPKMAKQSEDALPKTEGTFGGGGHLRENEEAI